MTEDTLARIRAYLSKIPEPAPLDDDFNAMDASGGNFDDAYSLGEGAGNDAGAYTVAQHVLRMLDGKV